MLLGSAAFAATELVPSTHAVQVTQNALELHLFAPSTASPGQIIGIELWTIFENVTSNRSDLAFNHTSIGFANTTLSFRATTNIALFRLTFILPEVRSLLCLYPHNGFTQVRGIPAILYHLSLACTEYMSTQITP